MAMWMAYATLTGALLSLAAWLTQSAAHGRSLPTRFVWLSAMVATVALPCLAFMPAREATVEAAASNPAIGAAEMMPIMLQMLVHGAPDGAAAAAPGRDYDRTLLEGWAFLSAALAAGLAAALVALGARRRTWRSARVDGVDILVARDAGPAAVGIFSPRIVLPEWALGADARALELMLEHEIEHVRARDPILLASVGLLLVAMPWNVALWWQAARLRQALELDCDARVLRRHPDPQAYGTVLLDVARGESRWLLASPAMARRRSLERRIRLLVARRRRARTVAFVLVAAASVVTLACGLERPRPNAGRAELRSADVPSPLAHDGAPTNQPRVADVALVAGGAPEANVPVADEPVAQDGRSQVPEAPRAAEPADTPVFTPMTQIPTVRNHADVAAALRRFYPPVLRDAGIEGTAVVWIYIDEEGLVQRTSLRRSSGHSALDDAALRVAQMIEFTPARNGDRPVAVWVQWPIVFTAPGDADVRGASNEPRTDPDYRMLTFAPSVDRPTGYPDRLPFLRDVGATVTDFEDGVRAAIMWFDPPADVVDRAATLSRAEGWVVVSDSTRDIADGLETRVVEMQRNGIERQIIGSANGPGIAMLVQGDSLE